MDPSNFNFTMKTGSNNNNESNIDEKTYTDIMAIILTFAENSIKSADTYCNHANRKVINKKDIKLAMQWEVFMYLKRDNTKKLSKHLKRIVNYNEGNLDEETESESDYEFESENNSNNKINREKIEEVFTKSECDCNVCKSMNNTDNIWNNWIPSNEIEKIFKYNIDKI